MGLFAQKRPIIQKRGLSYGVPVAVVQTPRLLEAPLYGPICAKEPYDISLPLQKGPILRKKGL